MNTMLQAYVPRAHEMAFREIERPVPSAGEVVIKVSRIGICGSDIHAFKGKHPIVSFPLTPGHEFSGYIEELGPEVEGWSKGDLVTVEPAIGCGTCPKCQVGLIGQCNTLQFIGGGLPGAGSPLFKVNQKQVVKFPQEVGPDDSAMTEPLAVAIHAVQKISDLNYKNVFIAGGGTIGLLVAQVSRLSGASRILISEKQDYRAQIARKLGLATVSPNPALEKEIIQFFGAVPKVTFECVGAEAPLNTCIHVVERGGYVIVAGVYEEPPKTDMVQVQDKEINLSGTLMYTFDDFRKAADWITKKKVTLSPLQTHHFPFRQWGEAYRFIESPQSDYLKVFIDMDEP
ncbi:MAG: alcohol dehydrogenase catalytic domain-containing protein [Candidatus Atribacteria bacterium]|nr:alcohol dehydrogenase catalytic domain-containing protein [Candidatus Atribacteria bacterium]